MGDTPNYNIGALGGYDINSLMNNPYFLMAAQSPNINFKSAQVQQAQQAQALSSAQLQTAADGAIPVIDTSASNSSGGITLGEGILGAALIAGGAYALIKKPGFIGKAWNAIKGGAKSNAETGRLKNLTAIKCPDGRIRFNIPDKTTTKYGKQIQELVDNYGIQASISAERQAFNPSTSVLNTFKYNLGDKNRYVLVKTKDGHITKVVDAFGDDILKKLTDAESSTAEANLLDKLNKIVAELGKDTKEADTALLKEVSHINYTNTFGDDVLKLTTEKYGAVPKLREFTTLQRFNFTDTEMQTLKLNAGEEVFASSKFFKDGKLVDGIAVTKFSDKIGGGYVGNFEGETLVSIVKPDGTVLPNGSAGFKNIADEYKSNIDKLVRKIFVKREYIPNGSVLQAA